MRRHATWAGLLLLLFGLACLRQWASWSHWHVDDDLANLGWALVNRDQPWVAITELPALHDHIRPATLLMQWLGAQVGQGSWAGVHGVHLALGALAVLSLAWLAARRQGLAVAAVACALFMVQPGYGELPWWNAWMCSAGELLAGLAGLAALHRDLERARWPWRAALLMALAGLFKEPGWVIYPLSGAAMALAHWAQSKPRGAAPWAAMLGLPLMGALGFAGTFHSANVARLSQGKGDFLVAVGDWSDPMFGAVQTPFSGAALPLPLIALALLSRAGLPWYYAALGALPAWGLGLLSPSLRGLSLLLLLSIALVGAARKKQLALGALLAVLSFGVMAPFPYPHPVQVIAGLAGLSLAVAVGLHKMARELPPWGQAALGISVLLGVGMSVSRQPRPLHGSWPNNLAMERQQLFLGTLAIAQVTHSQRLNYDPEEAELWQLAPLGGLQTQAGQSRERAIGLAGADLSSPTGEMGVNLLEGLELKDLRRARPRIRQPGGEEQPERAGEPTLILKAGLYVLAVEGQAGPERSLLVRAKGPCGVFDLRSAGPAAVHAQPILLHQDCALELLRTADAVGKVTLYELPMPTLSLARAQLPQPPPAD